MWMSWRTCEKKNDSTYIDLLRISFFLSQVNHGIILSQLTQILSRRVRFSVFQPVHLDSSPRVSKSVRIFLNLFQYLTGTILFNGMWHVMTSSITVSKLILPEVLLGVSMYAYMHLRLYRVSSSGDLNVKILPNLIR